MIASMNWLMVYLGKYAAERDSSYLEERLEPKWAHSVHTTTTGQQVGEQTVYHTDFHYFVAAVLVELICIALVAPTYIGWWKLGRPVSFSPLEFGKVRLSP